jgi:20S proteasome alpha/beta subunit
MTTVIGIKGKDKESLESFVILCSDSIGSKNDKPISGNEKKIFTGEDSNYAVGSAGCTLENYFLRGTHAEEQAFLNKRTFMSKPDIEKMIINMNAKLIEGMGESNSYLVSLVSPEPGLFTLGKEDDKEKLVDAKSYSVIGSGKNYASSLSALDLYKQDGRIWLPKKTLIDTSLTALREIAEHDSCTGGHMDVAIITPFKVIFLQDYAKIRNTAQSSYLDSFDMNSSDGGNMNPLSKVNKHLDRMGYLMDES